MEKKEINISTIEGLIDALNHSEVMTRAATLQAIALYPEKASSLAKRGNIDLFNTLIGLRDKPTEAGMRIAYLNAQLSLDDERVLNMAKEEFLASDNSDILLLIASKLAQLPEDERVSFLGPVVMTTAYQTKRRAAANLIAQCQNLPSELRIRVALASDHAVPLAPLDNENIHQWIEALQGQYPNKARKMLLAKEDGSFTTLLANWDSLPVAVKVWALKETLKAFPKKHESLVWEVLKQEKNKELLLLALEALKTLPKDSEGEALLAAFSMHNDAEIRAAAFKVSNIGIDWEKALKDESAEIVQVAIISRIGRDRHTEHLDLLATLLEDTKNWRIRSAITHAMVDLVPDSIPVLQKLHHHHLHRVKAAAVQALKYLDTTLCSPR